MLVLVSIDPLMILEISSIILSKINIFAIIDIFCGFAIAMLWSINYIAHCFSLEYLHKVLLTYIYFYLFYYHKPNT